MYTPLQKAILVALGTIYDDEGALNRDEAEHACAELALDAFYELERRKVLQFAKDGSLYYMPSDTEIETLSRQEPTGPA